MTAAAYDTWEGGKTAKQNWLSMLKESKCSRDERRNNIKWEKWIHRLRDDVGGKNNKKSPVDWKVVKWKRGETMMKRDVILRDAKTRRKKEMTHSMWEMPESWALTRLHKKKIRYSIWRWWFDDKHSTFAILDINFCAFVLREEGKSQFRQQVSGGLSKSSPK